MGLRSKNKVSPNFNMSSMTDIVFLLLIFFMLTSTLVTQNALDLVLPKSTSKNTKKPSVSVGIDEDTNNEINFSVEDEAVLFENLESILKEKLNAMEESDNKGIVLYTDKSVDIEHVVKIMDIAYRNKYKIVLATSQEE